MRIAIMGSGGIGGFYGAQLAQDPDNDVWFIARGAHLEAIRKNGLVMKSPGGNVTVSPAQATSDPAEIGPVDMVVFAVKLYSVPEVAAFCRPLVGEHTGVISMQNGIGSEVIIDDVLGAGHAIGGIVYAPLRIEAPGVIRHDSPNAQLVVGEMTGEKTDRLTRFIDSCHKVGINVAESLDIQTALWEKFVMISSFAGLTCLTRQPVRAIQEDEITFDLFTQALRETIAIARAEGFELDGDTLVEKFTGIVRSMLGEAQSSMLTDLENGNALENDWFSGMIYEKGQQHGIPTPVHQAIYVALKPFAAGSG
ncbi:MAG: 2-dehydropantoate 2-reductase [Proteobacteria bacterium]|nr:2-dehydropantoate 2-reductase [Pseudomonadota bacterium]